MEVDALSSHLRGPAARDEKALSSPSPGSVGPDDCPVRAVSVQCGRAVPYRSGFNRRLREKMLNTRRRRSVVTRFACAALAASFAATAACAAADGDDIPSVTLHHQPSVELLKKDTIRVKGAGTVHADFNTAVSVLVRPDLLDLVQREYASSLPPGTQPEFVLQPAGSNAWTYVNSHGRRSEVIEVVREFDGTNTLTSVFYAAGDRFFGRFESLTIIRVVPAGGGEIGYSVEVFAYPHQPLCRFVVRNMGLLRRFFESKTRELEDVSARVCTRICSRETG
jgi:hypothetical protein